MKTIFDAATHESLRERAGRLTPDSPRHWGRMTSHQGACHLNDSFLLVLGDRTTDFRANSLFNRTVGRFLALSTPVPWPKGVRTSPETDQERNGTPPGVFDEDVAQLRDLMARFRDTGGEGLGPAHRARTADIGRMGTLGIPAREPSPEPVRRLTPAGALKNRRSPTVRRARVQDPQDFGFLRGEKDWAFSSSFS